MILEIIGIKIAVDIAASIATWCFNNAAENQRTYQRHLVDYTRRELRAERDHQYQIQREARQAAWEARQAAHQAHFEMLNDVSDSIKEMADAASQILKQFQAINAQNRSFLKSLALTPEQRAAIHECNDQLARGCQRLHAYIGPYLRLYRSELHKCREALRNHEFTTPSLPSPVLPESFPFSGELMEFDAGELGNYPFVDLGHEQQGRFITASRTSPRPEGSLVGIIDRYDRDSGFWIISAARGALAMDLENGNAFRQPRNVTLAEWRGDARIAWWQHQLGEKIMLRFEEGTLSQRMRRAPWGTQVSGFVQSADFFIRWIRVGERIARTQKFAGWSVPCLASNDFWNVYAAASAFSNKMLIREAGMQGDPVSASLVLRLATGHEYPIHMDAHADKIVVGNQCGQRLGLIQEAGRNLYVFLLQGNLTSDSPSESDVATRLFSAVRESFAEQRDLALLAEADALELRKYRAVLQAEFEASKRRNSARVEFTDWSIVDSPKTGKFVVHFQGDGTLPDGFAVRVVGEEEILGWSQACETPRLSEVVILRDRRRAFRDEDFPHADKLETTQMDRELLNKLDGIENFLSAAAAEVRSPEEQQAFSSLRRELLGHFSNGNEQIESYSGESQLDEHQQRAVSLLAGTAPLVLIQGPPGTGKTHVISHAINQLLTRNPRARIAITSQANPAVDEAVAKIQESFPDLQIYRDYSAAAKEKYASLDRGVGIDRYHTQFIEDLEAAAVPDNAQAAYVQSWLKKSMREDSADVEADMKQILAQGSQVLAIMRRSRRPIAECISSCFYHGDLIPGRDDQSPTIRFPLSLMWIDSAKTRHEAAGKTSIRNRGEVDLIFSVLSELPQMCKKDTSVAVIAFHRGQAELLTAEIRRKKHSIMPAVLTVDASQGGQWDVVILTLARTAGGSGFVGNPNRLNVALSRAKELCIVIGSRSFAENDRTEGSSLSDVLRFVHSEPKKGKWMVLPKPDRSLPPQFGFPPPRKRRAR